MLAHGEHEFGIFERSVETVPEKKKKKPVAQRWFRRGWKPDGATRNKRKRAYSSTPAEEDTILLYSLHVWKNPRANQPTNQPTSETLHALSPHTGHHTAVWNKTYKKIRRYYPMGKTLSYGPWKPGKDENKMNGGHTTGDGILAPCKFHRCTFKIQTRLSIRSSFVKPSTSPGWETYSFAVLIHPSSIQVFESNELES